MPTTTLPDGRTAQLWTGGADEGPVVLVCHGTPDTRWVARTGAAAARTAGVRLVCVNRPGYGRSTPADSTYDSVADDARAVLAGLGVGRCAVLGMSVGGVHAAALAARHPELVTALALVAAPREVPLEVSRAEFEAWVAGIDPADPDDEALTARWLGSIPAADAALLGASGAAAVAASAREALASPEGYLRDATLLGAPWGLDLAAVRCPAFVWSGADDERNPPSTGEWWVERVEGAELTVTPTTHLATLLANWASILSGLTRGG